MKKLSRLAIVLSLVAVGMLESACNRNESTPPPPRPALPQPVASSEAPGTPNSPRPTCVEECRVNLHLYCFPLATDYFSEEGSKLYKIASSLKEGEEAPIKIGKKNAGTFLTGVDWLGKWDLDLTLKVSGTMKVRRLPSKELRLAVVADEGKTPVLSGDDDNFNEGVSGPIKGIEFDGQNPILETQPSDRKTHECVSFHRPRALAE